ncbi:MAG: sulfur carrier protein ThiS [Bacteroidales bacterium]|nr:sulfur carrier protein ThiS [Bacteroidales bacterium]
MKIEVNKKQYEVVENYTVQLLIDEIIKNRKNIAIAVNNRVISYNEWSNYKLSNNDKVIIIRAACGG